MHLHAPARRGENADVMVTLNHKDSSFSGKTVLTEEQARLLRSGLVYINVHTKAHPNGEIRGQIELDQDGTSVGGELPMLTKMADKRLTETKTVTGGSSA